MGIPDLLTCLLRNLYSGQEVAVRTRHGTTDWLQNGKGVRQGCILSLCLFNLNAKCHSAVLSRFRCVQLLATLWTAACEAPPSLGFSRREYWSGLPCPPPGDLLELGVGPTSPALAGGFFTTSTTWETLYVKYIMQNARLDESQAGIMTDNWWEKYQQPQICRWHHSISRKGRGTKEPLDEGGGEWKRRLETQKKTKIMASRPLSSWKIEGEKVEAVTDFVFLGSKITTVSDCDHEFKRR